jgi:hypothetical protein
MPHATQNRVCGSAASHEPQVGLTRTAGAGRVLWAATNRSAGGSVSGTGAYPPARELRDDMVFVAGWQPRAATRDVRIDRAQQSRVQETPKAAGGAGSLGCRSKNAFLKSQRNQRPKPARFFKFFCVCLCSVPTCNVGLLCVGVDADLVAAASRAKPLARE